MFCRPVLAQHFASCVLVILRTGDVESGKVGCVHSEERDCWRDRVGKHVAGVDCRWHSSGRLARGGLRGTSSNGTPIHVGLKLRVRSVRFGMAVYAMHSRMPLISLVQYHPSVTRHSRNMCVSSTTPNSIYRTMSGFKLTLGHCTDAIY